jgi:hypothetical protein
VTDTVEQWEKYKAEVQRLTDEELREELAGTREVMRAVERQPSHLQAGHGVLVARHRILEREILRRSAF